VELIVGDGGQSFELHVPPPQLPFIALLEQQRADKPVNRGIVWKIPATSVRRFISAFRR